MPRRSGLAVGQVLVLNMVVDGVVISTADHVVPYLEAYYGNPENVVTVPPGDSITYRYRLGQSDPTYQSLSENGGRLAFYYVFQPVGRYPTAPFRAPEASLALIASNTLICHHSPDA